MLVGTFIALEEELVPVELLAEPVAEPVRSGTGDPTAVAPTPESTGVPSLGVVTSLLPTAIAAAWYAAKVLLPVVGALILPTMPSEQCKTCLQNHQMGFVSVMLILKVAEDNKPESKPAEVFAEELAARYVHGLAKVD